MLTDAPNLTKQKSVITGIILTTLKEKLINQEIINIDDILQHLYITK